MSFAEPSSSFRRRSRIDQSYELEDKKTQVVVATEETSDVSAGEVTENADALQRRLSNRQIQLIAIGGSIGRSSQTIIDFC